MVDIIHTVRVKAPREKVYEALSTIDGLAAWWTRTTEGASAPGETIAFRFGQHVTKVRVEELARGGRVAWRVTESSPDWVGTRMTFDLSEQDGATLVRFGHRDWAEANDFYGHCSMKWATFLLSLKSVVETGAGAPFPNDVAI